MDLFQLRLTVQEMCDDVAKSFSEELAELISAKTYLAGGVFKSLVLDEKVNDWDFWFKDLASCKRFMELIEKEKYTNSSSLTNKDKLKLSKILVKTDNAYTFRFPKATVQFIIVEVGTPQEVTGKFDFKHTQCYYDPVPGDLSCSTKYIIGKELRFNPTALTPLSALKRAFRFSGEGWKVPDSEIEAIVKAVGGLDWKNPEVVKKQTKGLYSQPTTLIDRDMEEADEAPRATRPQRTVAYQAPAPEWQWTTTATQFATNDTFGGGLTLGAVNQAAGTVTLRR